MAMSVTNGDVRRLAHEIEKAHAETGGSWGDLQTYENWTHEIVRQLIERGWTVEKP
jgi:hypothetical protein